MIVCIGIISGEAAIPVEVVLMTVSNGNAQGKRFNSVHFHKSTPVYFIL